MKPYIALILLWLTAGCFRNDLRTETLYIEQLQSEEDAAQVAQALHVVSGITAIRSDPAKHMVRITFDGQTTHLKNIEYALFDAGFNLPNWPSVQPDKADVSGGKQQ